jgi:DNA polymerase III psi subunit
MMLIPMTGRTQATTTQMPDSRQQAYLEAMDIDIWCSREAIASETVVGESAARLRLGPGNDGILLICAADTDSSGRLANDINRALGSTPVWAWPDDDATAVGISQAVEENLFTMVAVFGNEVAPRLFSGELPAHLNSAKLVVLPSMQDVKTRAQSRRELWSLFCSTGMLVSG